MTSGGSPYARFKRALLPGNLALVRAAAAELPAVDLADALAICLLSASRSSGPVSGSVSCATDWSPSRRCPTTPRPRGRCSPGCASACISLAR